MKKKMTLNTYGYDCGQLLMNFSPFEFYCFIIKGKLPTSINRTYWHFIANDHFDDLYGAALNLPMCNRVKKGPKKLSL